MYWILGLYFGPMVINIVFQYFEENISMQTIGDLLKYWYFYFFPIFNLIITFIVLCYYISKYLKIGERWKKFKNIKIR